MPFDPDKYIAEKLGQNKAFDPDAYILQKTGKPFSSQGEAPSIPETLLRQASSGSSFGLADELNGALEAAGRITGIEGLGTARHLEKGEGLNLNVPTLNWDEIVKSYKKGRDSARADEASDSANPITSFVGNVVGGLATVPGLQGASLAKNAALSEKLVNAAIQGGKVGGLYGFGSSNADLTQGQYEQAIHDTLGGATVGGVTGAALEKLISKINPETLNKWANKKVVKATGATTADYKKLVANDSVDDVGQRLWDTGTVGTFTGPEEILANAEVAKDKFGKAIGGNLKTFDESGKLSTLPDPRKIIEKIQEQRQPDLIRPTGEPYLTTSTNNNQLNNIVDDISSHGNTPISFEEAQRLKMMLKKAAYDDNGNVINGEAKAAYGILNKEIENSAEKTAEAVGSPQSKDDYINNKKNYAANDLAERFSTGKVAKDAVNRELSLTDYIAGGAGLLAHGNPAGVAASLTNKAVRTYYNTVGAGAAKGLSALFKMPKQGLQKVAEFMSTQGEAGQKLGQVLSDAAKRDDLGRNALLFSLMQQPTYRQLLNSHFGEEDGK